MKRLLRWWQTARGAQTVEWVALALVVLALLGAVTRYLNGPGGAQVAAPIQQALQQYVWCLEGASVCPGAGAGVGDGLGSQSPSGPMVRPDLSELGGDNLLDRVRERLKAWWEYAQHVAVRTWEVSVNGVRITLEVFVNGARAIWKIIEEHKGIVVGILIALPLTAALVIALVAGLPAIVCFALGGAAVGAFVFGLVYHFGIPEDHQTWGGAFVFVVRGAGIGALVGCALYVVGLVVGAPLMSALKTKVAFTVMKLITKKEVVRLAGRGAIDGISSGISHLATASDSERNIFGFGRAFLIGASQGILEGNAARIIRLTKLKVLAKNPKISEKIPEKFIGGVASETFVEAFEKGKIQWDTPATVAIKRLIGDKVRSVYNKVFGRAMGRGIGRLRGIGWLRRKGIRVNPPKPLMQIVNQAPFNIAEEKAWDLTGEALDRVKQKVEEKWSTIKKNRDL